MPRKKKNWEKQVLAAFQRHPANQTNNDLCWASVIEAMYARDGITPPREFINKIIEGKLPSSHSIAAAISNVRASNPEYELTDELKVMKQSHRQDWITHRNEYLTNGNR